MFSYEGKTPSFVLFKNRLGYFGWVFFHVNFGIRLVRPMSNPGRLFASVAFSSEITWGSLCFYSIAVQPQVATEVKVH